MFANNPQHHCDKCHEHNTHIINRIRSTHLRFVLFVLCSKPTNHFLLSSKFGMIIHRIVHVVNCRTRENRRGSFCKVLQKIWIIRTTETKPKPIIPGHTDTHTHVHSVRYQIVCFCNLLIAGRTLTSLDNIITCLLMRERATCRRAPKRTEITDMTDANSSSGSPVQACAQQ